MIRLTYCCLLLGCLQLLAGCGSSASPEDIREASQQYEQAQEKLEAGDYAAARELLAGATDGGGLNVDAWCAARVQLAFCEAHLGNFEAAHEILEELMQGAPDMARVHAMRAFVYEKQGNASAARQEMARAREYDPRIEPIG